MELRRAASGEVEDFSRALMRGFHAELKDELRERLARVLEPERSLLWDDDGAIVATSGAFTRKLTVPGAIVGCAAVTMVTVRATHRRRGLLVEMMRGLLDDARAAGEPVAALWASEGGIYGRFGYGIATRSARLEARRPAARLAEPPPRGEPLRAGPAADHLDALGPVFEQARVERPGMLDRDGPWLEDRLFDPESERGGAHPLHAVVTDDGYALYAVKPSFDGRGEVVVRELLASTPGARAELWAFLLDQDLTDRITWGLAPLDEPLWLMLTDPRAVTRAVSDALWVRLVDVEAALTARSLAGEPRLVLDVSDSFCPWNAGRHRLTAGGCERTDEPADLSLDAACLGAVYLGGTTFRELADAGRVAELRTGAVAEATAAFRSERAPWCPEIF